MQKRFADSARIAVLIGTGACVVLSAVAALHDARTDAFDAASYATLWVVFWPPAFATALWVDVKRTVARKVGGHLRHPPA